MQIDLRNVEDAAAFGMRLQRRNAQRADRGEEPLTPDQYATEVLVALLQPERDEMRRQRAVRIAQKIDALPVVERSELLGKLGEV